MAGPGRVETSSTNTGALEQVEQTSAPPPPPATTGSHDWPTTREAFSQRTSALDSPAPLLEGDTLVRSANELQREAAVTSQARKELKAALGIPLRDLARKHPEGDFRFSKEKFGLEDALHSESALKALGTMSRADATQAIREHVKQTWPKLEPAGIDEITHKVASEIGESLRYQTATKMKNTAVSMMETTAKHFKELATDPKALAKFADQLEKLPIQEERHIKDLFGLNEPTPLHSRDPKKMAERLLVRAKMIEAEASKLDRTSGGDRTLMAVAEHDVRTTALKAMGAREGSWLASAAGGAQAEGASLRSQLTGVKIATSVATAYFTGGLSLGLAVSAGSSMAIGAPALTQAWRNVDAARAGESAGTMPEGSVETAKTNRAIATGGFVASAAAPAILHAPAHHLEKGLEPLVGEFVAKGAAHALPHAAIEGAETVAHQHRPHGPTGQTAQDKLADRSGGAR